MQMTRRVKIMSPSKWYTFVILRDASFAGSRGYMDGSGSQTSSAVMKIVTIVT